METKRTLTLDESTVGELRAAVRALEGWPDDAIVRVRTRANFHADGGRARSITILARADG